MNWTKLCVYAVAAAAICAVALGVARDTGNAVWVVLPGVFVAVYMAERGRGCSRGGDDA